MAFPPKLLNEGEAVVLDLHPHWWYLSGPIALVVVLLAGTVAAEAAGAPTVVKLLGVALLVVAFAWLLRRYLKWHTNNFVLTSDRLVHRSGIIAKQGREIPLDHINDISYHQSMFERIIGAGDLIIESAGERGEVVFPDLPKPGRIQNEIYRQMEGAKVRQRTPVVAAPPSIPEQIDQLDELRRRGVLTQAEFDAKKTDLLNRL